MQIWMGAQVVVALITVRRTPTATKVASITQYAGLKRAPVYIYT